MKLYEILKARKPGVASDLWTMMLAKAYGGSSAEWHTVTDTPPITINSDGTNATVSLKGNEQHTGTPSPQNPVAAVGVGTLDSGKYKITILNGLQTVTADLSEIQSARQVKKIVLNGTENITYESGKAKFRIPISDMQVPDTNSILWYCSHYEAVSNHATWSSYDYLISWSSLDAGDKKALRIRDTSISTLDDFKSYLVQQYENNTPVTIWYILETAETTVVNEPLMKIGDYTDSISNISIATTSGSNTIDVDTTVKPSEMTIQYKG